MTASSSWRGRLGLVVAVADSGFPCLDRVGRVVTTAARAHGRQGLLDLIERLAEVLVHLPVHVAVGHDVGEGSPPSSPRASGTWRPRTEMTGLSPGMSSWSCSHSSGASPSPSDSRSETLTQSCSKRSTSHLADTPQGLSVADNADLAAVRW